MVELRGSRCFSLTALKNDRLSEIELTPKPLNLGTIHQSETTSSQNAPTSERLAYYCRVNLCFCWQEIFKPRCSVTTVIVRKTNAISARQSLRKLTDRDD